MKCSVSLYLKVIRFRGIEFMRFYLFDFQIFFLASMSVFSLSKAISVGDYYHDHHSHPAHVKYIEPSHAHMKRVKYIESEPMIKQIPAVPVKYLRHAPHAVKYMDHPHYEKHVDYDEPSHYEYGYDVADHHTGDYKSHTEKRDGNTVHGRYEVLDPDGFKRIVEYTADEHNGFNAVVRREPTDVKVVKKFYDVQPENVKTVPVQKYYSHAEQKYYAPEHPKFFKQPVHQKIVVPFVKQIAPPQYYAAPEHLKFFKPAAVEKVATKTHYDIDSHTDVKYAQPNYNHHYY